MTSRCFPSNAAGVLARGAWLAAVIAVLGSAPSLSAQIEGIWMGKVTAPQGEAEIGFDFERNAKGELNFSLYFPLMNTFGAKFDVPVTREGDVYTEPVLASRLELKGDAISGTFGPGKLPLTLTRGGTFGPPPPVPVYPAGPAVAWTFPLGAAGGPATGPGPVPGLTWAAPVHADGLVLVGTREGKFHAVHAADGRLAWTWSGPNRIDGRAVVAGDRILFVDGKVDLVCLAKADGALLWRTPLYDEKLAGKPLPDNPTFNRRTATPLAVDGTVFCGSADGGLYALELATGKVLWRHAAGAPIFSGIGQAGPNTLTFGTMDGGVVVFDSALRKETMRARTAGGVVTTPVIVDGTVIAGSRDYLLYGFDTAGAVKWKFSYWFSWIESTGVVQDGTFYVGASDYRRVTAFDPASGKPKWGTDVRGLAWGTPLVTSRTVYIGTVAQNIPGTAIVHTGGIVALDRATGAVQWQHLAPPAQENSFGGYAGSLATDGRLIFAAGFDGNLIALPAE